MSAQLSLIERSQIASGARGKFTNKTQVLLLHARCETAKLELFRKANQRF